MQGSRFSTRYGACAQSALIATAIAWAPLAVADGTLQTIYSAEHALYGAGYDIGRADGWIDETLRAAIRSYQADAAGLKASGNLDYSTLKALGINAAPQTMISGNAVSRRGQALAALDLKEVEKQRQAPAPVAEQTPRQVAQAVAQKAAQPAVQQPVEQPAQPVAQQPVAPAPRAVAVAEPAQEKQPEAPIAPPPEPVKTTVQAPVEATELASEENSEPFIKQEDTDSISKEVKESELIAQLPTEPTAAGPVSTTTDKPAPRPRSSGGFFSSLFDFLFGWLV